MTSEWSEEPDVMVFAAGGEAPVVADLAGMGLNVSAYKRMSKGSGVV